MRKEAVVTYFQGNARNILSRCSKYGFDVKFYNKKNDYFGIKVPNIGVDVFDKFHYIVNNYYDLPEIVLFLTDTSFDSIKKRRQINFVLEKHYFLYHVNGFLTGHIYKISNEDINFYLEEYKGKKILPASVRPFGKWFNQKIYNDVNIRDIFINKKGVFAITRDLILSNPLSFYLKFLEELQEFSINGHDSEVTHFFERAYVEIFCKNNTKLMFHNFRRYGKLQ